MLSRSALLVAAAAYVWLSASLHLTSRQLVPVPFIAGQSCSNLRAHKAEEHRQRGTLVESRPCWQVVPLPSQAVPYTVPRESESESETLCHLSLSQFQLLLRPSDPSPMSAFFLDSSQQTMLRSIVEPLLHAGTPHHLLALTLRAIRTSSCLTSPPDKSGRLPHSLLVTHFQTCRLRCRDMGTFRFSL